MSETRGTVTGYHGFTSGAGRRELVIDVTTDADWAYLCPLSGITLDGELPETPGAVVDFLAKYHETFAVVTDPRPKETVGNYTPCSAIALTAFEVTTQWTADI